MDELRLLHSVAQAGLIEQRDIVGGRVTVEHRRRQHYCWLIRAPNCTVAVKRADRALGLARRYRAFTLAVANDAALQQSLATLCPVPGLGGHYLVTRTPPRTRSLWDAGPGRALPRDPAFAAALASIVARVHLAPTGTVPVSPVPAVFNLNPASLTLVFSSPATRTLVSRVQNDLEICRALRDLTWTGNCVIHGDLTLDNVVTVKQRPRPILIDFDLAGTGDSDWDIGSLQALVLLDWLLAGGEHNHWPTVVATATRVRSAYSETSGRAPRLRWTKFTGARMLQYALDCCHQLFQPDPLVEAMWRVARLLLTRPVDAGAIYLGAKPSC